MRARPGLVAAVTTVLLLAGCSGATQHSDPRERTVHGPVGSGGGGKSRPAGGGGLGTGHSAKDPGAAGEESSKVGDGGSSLPKGGMPGGDPGKTRTGGSETSKGGGP